MRSRPAAASASWQPNPRAAQLRGHTASCEQPNTHPVSERVAAAPARAAAALAVGVRAASAAVTARALADLAVGVGAARAAFAARAPAVALAVGVGAAAAASSAGAASFGAVGVGAAGPAVTARAPAVSVAIRVRAARATLAPRALAEAGAVRVRAAGRDAGDDLVSIAARFDGTARGSRSNEQSENEEEAFDHGPGTRGERQPSLTRRAVSSGLVSFKATGGARRLAASPSTPCRSIART